MESKENINKTSDVIPDSIKREIIANSLKELAIYLSGVKDGKGNLLPLGTVVLDNLWEAIKILRDR